VNHHLDVHPYFPSHADLIEIGMNEVVRNRMGLEFFDHHRFRKGVTVIYDQVQYHLVDVVVLEHLFEFVYVHR
jgi:hypothetical protein